MPQRLHCVPDAPQYGLATPLSIYRGVSTRSLHACDVRGPVLPSRMRKDTILTTDARVLQCSPRPASVQGCPTPACNSK